MKTENFLPLAAVGFTAGLLAVVRLQNFRELGRERPENRPAPDGFRPARRDGRLIQAAVNRQREFLADASSVQFTRNPSGLAGALRKIGGLSYGSKLDAVDAEEASHMFFSNGMGESFLHLMDTHPPLEGVSAPSTRASMGPSCCGITGMESAHVAGFPASASADPVPLPGDAGHAGGSGWAAAAGIVAAAMMPSLGTPTTAHLRYAGELRGSIPASLQAAAREALGASAMVYALLLSDDEAARRRQLDELTAATSAAICQETLRVLPDVQTVATHAKLPLVNLALPGLRHLSLAQFQQFRAAVQKLVESHGEIDLFEYVLQKIILRHLERCFSQARKPVVQYYLLKPLMPDCAVLLSALAYVGQDEPDKILFAFQQGAQPLCRLAPVRLAWSRRRNAAWRRWMPRWTAFPRRCRRSRRT